jgi:hypothetical protein
VFDIGWYVQEYLSVKPFRPWRGAIGCAVTFMPGRIAHTAMEL